MDSVAAFDPTDPVPPPQPARQGWRALGDYRFEVILFLLLLATFAAVRFENAILTRSIAIEPGSSLYTPNYYGDADQGGKSTIRVDPRRPLQWTCNLSAAYAYRYCGYELALDHKTPNRGYDLSGLETITVSLDYSGPSDTFRIYLKNFDPRYSKPGEATTLKFNKVEVAASPGYNDISLKTSDFAVAEWWVTNNKIKPALSHTQLDDVTEIQFQTGSLAPPGTYKFGVRRIVLHIRLISEATWYATILTAWTLLIGLYLIYRIVKLRRDLERRRQSQAAAVRIALHAEESARRDYLTKLLNRAGIINLYHRMATDRREEGAFAVILLDIDHFKPINDGFGHSAGDAVLAAIADILRENIRGGDVLGRWGGEEFLLICRVTDQDAAMRIADKLRAGIEAHEFPIVGQVTASFGVYCGSGQMAALEQLISYADAALYAAKEQGRNRAVLYQPFMREAA